ncbi:hypothetical protein [Pontimicrobium sp. MEBiC06410]
MIYSIALELTGFEIAEKISTILIAASTLAFSFYIYRYQLKKDDKTLKLDWYKLIVIESKFTEFFSFFKKTNESLLKLKTNQNMTEDNRIEINAEILNHFSNLRLEFISLLMSVDKMLYDCVLHKFDSLVDKITIELSKENVDFEEIEREISSHKTTILKGFVEFKGDNDTYKGFC